MLSIVNIARAQISYQQLSSTEHIQRQEAVMVIVSVEERTDLATVNRIISTIKIQNQLNSATAWVYWSSMKFSTSISLMVQSVLESTRFSNRHSVDALAKSRSLETAV